MMEDVIRNFPKQFAWEPEVQNAGRLERKEILVAAGMGGSALPVELLQAVDPAFDIVVHRDYGLSGIPESVLKQSWVVAISYSGNTEETLSAFEEAAARRIPLCAISVGGKLLERAREHKVPYIQIPDTHIQPRMALGFTFKALAKMAGRNDVVNGATALALQLNVEDFKNQGARLAADLKGKVPVVYASQNNYSLAYSWKISFNESAKIPSFYNVFPELNHNEINGFDRAESTKQLSENFYFIFLSDVQDHVRIQKRMEVLQTMYQNRGLQVQQIELKGSPLYKIFSSLMLADWVSYYLATQYGVEPELSPMVEEFKHVII